MIVSPFRLKPWHDGYRPFDRDPYKPLYLTITRPLTETPYGDPLAPDLSSFFKPIFQELYKKFKTFLNKYGKKLDYSY